EGTVGPNIGWRPTTDARDASIAVTGPVFSEVRSQRICSFERKGAISRMTGMVSRIGTDTMRTSEETARSRHNERHPLPQTCTSCPAREKTPAKSEPIFPVPPMIPTFMASLLNDTLPDRNPEVPAGREHPPENTVPGGKCNHRDWYPVLT